MSLGNANVVVCSSVRSLFYHTLVLDCPEGIRVVRGNIKPALYGASYPVKGMS